MRIVITGAAGMIGSRLVEELHASHELRLIDLRPVCTHPSTIADLSKPPLGTNRQHGWDQVFEGARAVVHLAANSQETASWPEVLGDNIEATWNVLKAAWMHRVPRVVFASSGWAVKAMEHKLAPDCYLANGPKIGSDVAARPVNPYGLSKALGETAGRMFVDQERLNSFVAVRIGAYSAAPTDEDEGQRLWIGRDDLRSLLQRCVEADFAGFHIVYGVSAQPSAPYDLSHTRTLLSWTPTQIAPNVTREKRNCPGGAS